MAILPLSGPPFSCGLNGCNTLKSKEDVLYSRLYTRSICDNSSQEDLFEEASHVLVSITTTFTSFTRDLRSSNHFTTAITSFFTRVFSRRHSRSSKSTMSKILVVFGVTGQQGGSVINSVLAEPDLSKQYKIRALTRDLSKPTAIALAQRGIELAQADADDKDSLKQAFKNVHTAFIVTTTLDGAGAKQAEIKQGKLIVDTAVAAGVKYIIFSSASPAAKICGKNVDIFDAKAEIEDYIRTLPVKSAFFAPGFFMENFRGHSQPRPTPAPGVYGIANIPAGDTRIPLLDTAADTGKFVAVILAHPDKYAGQVLYGATKLYSYDEVAKVFSDVTGKTVKYKQLPVEVFRGFLPPEAADSTVSMLTWFKDFGYYGPKTQEHVDWTLQQNPGKLTTFEDFLKKNPVNLQ
ncbi:hypothetical protein MMC18_004507 [Xylographa bjoerkii]|nr:hypothetical protein [Xylographa bjoerkii]